MLKINDFAKLAHTTKRTLIFYDKENIFKPARVAENGYRYYHYEQIYDFMFIIGLRNLGLSLKKIKEIKEAKDKNILNENFIQLQKQVTEEIEKLLQIKNTVNQQLKNNIIFSEIPINKPFIQEETKMEFWCSEKTVSCTEKEITDIFVKFYEELPPFSISNKNISGYLTDLSGSCSELYSTASFRMIKERNPNNNTCTLPVIIKPEGKFVSIKVRNTLEGVQNGLKKLKIFIKENNLKIDDNLWQINTDWKLQKLGSSEFGIIKYLIL